MDKFSLTAQLLLKPTGIPAAVNSVRNAFGNVNIPIKIKTDMRALQGIEKDMVRLRKEAQKTAGFYNEIGGILANAARRFAGISIATGTFLGLARAIKGGIGDAITFEREIAKIAQATETSINSANRLGKEVSSISKEYGTASNELVKFGRVFAQAGFSTVQTTQALKLLAKTDLAGTFGSMADTTETMITLLSVFGKESQTAAQKADFLEKAMDSINSVSKKYAVEAEDLGVAIRRTGSVFVNAGGNLNELLSVMTAVRSTTRESADTIANGLKTIFTRIQKKDTIEYLKELGIVLEDSTGKFIGPAEAIQKLSIALSSLQDGSILKSNILEKVAGGYQIGRLIPAIKSAALQNQVLNDAKAASGDLDKDVAIQQQILATRLAKTKEAFADLIREFYASSTFTEMADGALKFANSLIKIADAMQGLIPVLTVYAALAGAKLGFATFRSLSGGKVKPSKIHSTQINGYATGGRVGGKSGTDKNPAMLSKGEFVVNAKNARENYDLLSAINSGHKVGRFAKGTNRTSRYNASMSEAYDSVGLHETIPNVRGVTPALMNAKNAAYDSAGLPDTRKVEKAAESVGEAYAKQKKMLEDAIAAERKMADVELGLVSEMEVFKRAIAKLRSQIDGGKINPLLAGDIASNHASNKGASPGNRARIRNKLFDDSINEAISKGSNKAKMPDLANIKGSAMGGSSSSKAGVAGGVAVGQDDQPNIMNKASTAVAMLSVAAIGLADNFKLMDDANSNATKSALAMGGIFYSLANSVFPGFVQGLVDAKKAISSGGGMSLGSGLGALAIAVGIAAAASEFFASKLLDQASKLDEQVDKAIVGVEKYGGGYEDRNSTLLNNRRLAIHTGAMSAQGSRNAASNSRWGAGAGALSGAAAGALIGSFIPVIGTAIGAAIGLAAGGIAGAYTGSKNNTLTQNQIQGVKGSVDARYEAAQASYDFADSEERKKKFNAKDDLAFTSSTASSISWNANRARAGLEMVEKSQKGIDPEKRTAEQKKQYEDAKDAVEATSKIARESAGSLQTSIVRSINSRIENESDPKKIAMAFSSGLVREQIEKSKATFNQSTSDQSKRDTFARDTDKWFKELEDSAVRNATVQDSLNKAKEAEIRLIIETNNALNGLAQSSIALEQSQSAINIMKGSSIGGISSRRFSDISRVGNIRDFSVDAEAAGANVQGGSKIAKEVVNAASAINEIRSTLSVDQLKTIKKDSLTGGINTKAESQLKDMLKKSSSSFSGLNADIQETVVQNLHSQLMSGKLDFSSIESVVKDISDGAKQQAEILAQANAQSLEYLQQLGEVNDMVLDSQERIGNLRAGSVGIEEAGRQRLREVNKDTLTNYNLKNIAANKEASRKAAADAMLGATGVSRGMGNIGSLPQIAKDLQSKLNLNRDVLKNNSLSTSERGKLVTENQKLERAAKATTQELTRLANQSERAADIMGEIERARAGRDLLKSKATDFVLGGNEEKISVLEQFAGLQEVMKTGSFQTLPDDLRKSVSTLVDEMAKADPNGAAVQARDKAIANDVQMFAKMNGVKLDKSMLDALTGTRGTEEQNLVNDLRALNQQEKAAQDALIAVEVENTNTMTNLLTSINALINTIGMGGKANGFSRGGTIFAARGMDKVPVMAQAGEGIINKASVNKFGRNTIQAMNNGIMPNSGIDISALSTFSNNLKTSLDSVVKLVPESINNLTSSMNTVTTSLNGIAQSLSNITMKHEINVDGQLNINGINSPKIAEDIRDYLGEYIGNVVKTAINKQNQAFRTA